MEGRVLSFLLPSPLCLLPCTRRPVSCRVSSTSSWTVSPNRSLPSLSRLLSLGPQVDSGTLRSDGRRTLSSPTVPGLDRLPPSERLSVYDNPVLPPHAPQPTGGTHRVRSRPVPSRPSCLVSRPVPTRIDVPSSYPSTPPTPHLPPPLILWVGPPNSRRPRPSRRNISTEEVCAHTPPTPRYPLSLL